MFIMGECHICGKEIRSFPSQVGRKKYCSKQCKFDGTRLKTFDPSNIAARFWSKVDKNGPVPSHRPELGPCWVWTAACVDGYGAIGVGGHHSVKARANRISLEMSLGRDLLPGMWALHHCDNPPCVNPTHLFEGTPSENVVDMAAKGRMPRGSGRAWAKLDEEKVVDIRRRRAAGETQEAVASRYGVSRSIIYCIESGRNWTHVP